MYIQVSKESSSRKRTKPKTNIQHQDPGLQEGLREAPINQGIIQYFIGESLCKGIPMPSANPDDPYLRLAACINILMEIISEKTHGMAKRIKNQFIEGDELVELEKMIAKELGEKIVSSTLVLTEEEYEGIIGPMTSMLMAKITEVPKVLLAQEDGAHEGSKPKISEILALQNYSEQYEPGLLAQAGLKRGREVDFESAGNCFDPFDTPIITRPEDISNAYEDWFGLTKDGGEVKKTPFDRRQKRISYDEAAFPKHASGKSKRAKAILDISRTPKAHIELLTKIFREDLVRLERIVSAAETLKLPEEEKSDIFQMTNTYVVFYANMTRPDVVDCYLALKEVFDTARATFSGIEMFADEDGQEDTEGSSALGFDMLLGLSDY